MCPGSCLHRYGVCDTIFVGIPSRILCFEESKCLLNIVGMAHRRKVPDFALAGGQATYEFLKYARVGSMRGVRSGSFPIEIGSPGTKAHIICILTKQGPDQLHFDGQISIYSTSCRIDTNITLGEIYAPGMFLISGVVHPFAVKVEEIRVPDQAGQNATP